MEGKDRFEKDLLLRFADKRLEERFWATSHLDFVFYWRFCFLLGAVLYAGFVALDWRINHEFIRPLALIRLAVVTPVLLFGFLNTFTRAFTSLRYARAVNIFIFLVCGYGHFAMAFYADLPGAYVLDATCVVILFGYIFCVFELVNSILLTSVVIVGYELTAMSVMKLDVGQLVFENSFLMAFNGVGILAAYFIELGRKNAFVNRILIQQEQRRLAVEKDKFEAMVRHMGDGVVMLDGEGRVEVINLAAEELLSVRGTACVGKAPQEAFPAEAAAQVFAAAADRIEGMEREVVLPEPGKRILLMRSAPLLEPPYDASARRRERSPSAGPELAAGRLGTIVVFSDITAIRRLSDMKSEYVSVVSHELRSPLSVIKATAATLESSGAAGVPAEVHEEMLKTVGRQSDRLLRMINDLLDAARLEAGHELRVNATEGDLARLLHNMVTDHQASVGPRYALQLRLQGDIPSFAFDPERVEQIVANLLSNAVKYSPDGGTVTVRARRGDSEAVVSVSDQGLGIPQDDLPRLFAPYHRCDTVHHRKIKGTGLGLYLTKALVEAHGGWIRAESELGKGSTFTFALPLTTPA